MWRRRVVFRERALNFFELRHQVAFCVQTPRGITNEELDVAAFGGLVGFVAERRWIGVVLPTDHFNFQSIGPDRELLDGRGAKRIRRG